MTQPDKASKHYCSFCGKGDGEVKRMFIGPSTGQTVAICSYCILWCIKVVMDGSVTPEEETS